MRKTDARANGAIRRATDELLLARLLGVEEQRFAGADAQADEQLLQQLVLASEPPPVPQRHLRRIVLLAVVALLAVFTCTPLASAVNSLLAIRSNVAAMRLTAVEGQRSEVASLPQRQAKGAREQDLPAGPADTEPIAAANAAPAGAHRAAGDVSSTFDRQAPPARQAVAASAASAAAEPQNAGADQLSSGSKSDTSLAAPSDAAAGSTLLAIDESAHRGPPSTIDHRSSTRAIVTPEPAPEAAITVLLLGIDRRPGQTGPARADSVIVARIDPQAGRVALVSFPRDLQVEIPGVGWDRINATTVYGDMYPELGGGLDLSRRTVETLLGIPIDHAVSVDFGGFISAVDALGGITVDVEREVYDSFTENYFAAGPQHMDGRTALWYSRIRFLDSDFERMRRQQAVLLGLLRRIREQNALQQLHSIAAVTGALRGYIQTDLPEDRMVRLAWGLRNFAPEAVEQYRLEADQVDIFVNAADPYAQYLRPGAVESLVRKLLGPRINE